MAVFKDSFNYGRPM